MPNRTVTIKRNSISSLESKRNQKKLEGETQKMTFGFEMKNIIDARGAKVKCRLLSWTDLAILTAIKGIQCTAFLSFIKNEDGMFYAIFSYAFQSKEEVPIYYAVEIGDYDAVAGSHINHDSEESAGLWEKMAPER
ncbi:MAG: hypothetical protein K6G63_09420 [Eubacterium sp.]|nr:hypothetical protein [Eubacterium sp.]